MGGGLHLPDRPGAPGGAPVNTPSAAEIHAEAPHPSAPARLGWARLLKRVFDIDIEQCPQCGGTLTILATIEDPSVIAKILTHLGLPARAPPARNNKPWVPLFWEAERMLRSFDQMTSFGACGALGLAARYGSKAANLGFLAHRSALGRVGQPDTPSQRDRV